MHASAEMLRCLQRSWTVYLLHHAHTDIGYTDPQEIIRGRHVDFIDQALALHRRARLGEQSLRGFKWNSECFWSIECWLRANAPERHAELVQAIRDGAIGISATYLHFTELMDAGLTGRMLGRAAHFARTHALPLDTAISADVNGFGWGYADILHEHGIKHLIVCPHNAHGKAPIGERQQPFFWESPKGNIIWVWLGEHYLLGNMLGLAPGAVLTYNHTPDTTFAPHRWGALDLATERLPLYLSRLEQRGHRFNFVAVHIGGLMTDNAPPNEAIIRSVREWNERYGETVRLEMCTASEFAQRARSVSADAPVHRGDWPDWWSDGVASAPRSTRHFRQAQADYARRRELGAQFNIPLPPHEADAIDEALALYAEHTFGHAQSVQCPWGMHTTVLNDMKSSYAARAYQAVACSLETAFRTFGAPKLLAGRGHDYVVLNASKRRVNDLAQLWVEHFDQTVPESIQVVDLSTGVTQPHRIVHAASGRCVETMLELKPGEARWLTLRAAAAGATTKDCSGVSTVDELITRFVHIRYHGERGITQWEDRLSGVSLLQRDHAHAAFTPVHDVTAAAPALCGSESAPRQMAARGAMLLNRKGANAAHTAGTLVEVRPLPTDALQAATQLIFRMPGCAFVEVELRAWHTLPRVDVTVRLLKMPSWDAENVYLSLPFCAAAGQPGALWLDKAGVAIRPDCDLLPGALSDFACVQSGFARISSERGVLVTTLDAPMLQLGPLEAGPRGSAGAAAESISHAHVYGWLVTNYWETNFTADTGGFHEFRLRIEWGAHLREPRDCFALGQTLRQGLCSFRCVPR